MRQAAGEQLFFDPFAEQDGQEYFDPIAAHRTMWERYAAGEVEHDYTADEFVADTQALMLDAQFTGQFEQAQMIAQQMHLLCGEDHGLQASLRQNLGAQDMLNGLSHAHDHDGHADTDENAGKSSKKKKKKKRKVWFAFGSD